MKSIKTFYQRLKIRDKILISYLLLLIFWIFMLYFSNFKTNRIFERYLVSSVENMLEQAEANLSYKMKEMSNLSNQISYNTEIQNILIKDELYKPPLSRQYESYVALNDYVSKLSNVYGIYSIRLYLPNRVLYAAEEVSFYHMSLVLGETWYDSVTSMRGGEYWTVSPSGDIWGSRGPCLSTIRVIKDLRGDYSNTLGILKLEMDISEVMRILDRISAGAGSEAYLVDSSGTILVSAGPRQEGSLLGANTTGSISSPYFKDDDGSRKAVFSRRMFNSWSVVSILPYTEIMTESIKLRNENLLLVFLMSLISVVIILAFTDNMSKRLENVAVGMKEADFKSSPRNLEVIYNDEIGQIEHRFNEMLLRINSLLNEVKTIESKKSKAELAALQSQINPHFIYNIMDTVNWMAINQKAFNISRVVTLLGNLLRLSLSHRSDTVTLGEELEHVRLYVEIEKIRFGDSFDVVYDIDSKLLGTPVVKTTLQPLVENSIKHGMRQSSDIKGIIEISVSESDGNAVIKVTDNGPRLADAAGMQPSEDRGANVMASGYGLSNIRDRLNIYYHDQASLDISIGKEKTVVTMTIRVISV